MCNLNCDLKACQITGSIKLRSTKKVYKEEDSSVEEILKNKDRTLNSNKSSKVLRLAANAGFESKLNWN